MHFLNSTKHVVMNGITISPGSIVITSPENNDSLTFGEIKTIIITEEKRYCYAFMNARHWDTSNISTAGK